MRNINRVMIAGNLTRDAELRMTPNGTPIMNVGIAVNDARKNAQTGEWEDYANFIDCTMWGDRAESLAPKLTKGTKVAIEGKLRYNSWEKDGQKRSKVEVLIDSVEFFAKKDTEQAPQPQYFDEDVPF